MLISPIVQAAYAAASLNIRTKPYEHIVEDTDSVLISEVAHTTWNDELKKKHEENIAKQSKQYPFSYKYFENHSCEFWPCHKNATAGHNCMFCRCPLYNIEACIGIQNGDGIILDNGLKDCSNCTYNHDYINAESMSRSP